MSLKSCLHMHLHLIKTKEKEGHFQVLLHSLWTVTHFGILVSQTRAENRKEYKADIYDNSYRFHHEFM